MTAELDATLARAERLAAEGRDLEARQLLSALSMRAESAGNFRVLALARDALGAALQRARLHDEAATVLQLALDATHAWEEQTHDVGRQLEAQVCLAARIALRLAASSWPGKADRAVALATYATQRAAFHVRVEPAAGDEVRLQLGRAWLLLSGMYEATSTPLARLYARFALTVFTPSAPSFKPFEENARRLAGGAEVAGDEWRCVLALPATIAVAHPLGGRIARRRDRVTVIGAPALLDVVTVRFAGAENLGLESIAATSAPAAPPTSGTPPPPPDTLPGAVRS